MLAAFLALASCNNQFDRAMKSADKQVILQEAKRQYDNKKWANALQLYERATNLVAGTDAAADVVFYSAYANYYDKNYQLAGHQFKNFAVTNPNDPRREEAAYMSAICYYNGSMDYNLDQSSTELAITELQNFLDTYPDSERSKNINQMVDELAYKLEYKAYENARQYYKMADYKAAIVALENVLNDYPATKLKNSINLYLLVSRAELAKKSIYELKAERLDTALAFARQMQKESATPELAKESAARITELEREKVNFLAEQKLLGERKAQQDAKQQRMQETEKKERKGEEALKEGRKSSIDSAAATTPAPMLTIPVRN